MNQFFLHHQHSKELEVFPHILEFAIRKNTTIQLNSLSTTTSDSVRIYYVLEGEATLMLGGSLVEPNETAPGEWRAKSATGGTKVAIKKGDLIVVPRGTPHQRTVTGKGFSMILIKVFETKQP